MNDCDKEILDDKLTQADLIKLMLHNAQHMATRDEVKADISKVELSLKEDINKLDKKIDKVELSLKEDINKLDKKIDKVESSLKEDISKVESSLKADISKVESSLKADISKVESSLTAKIDKVDAKLDRFQWLIIATILTVLLKDYILALFH